MSEPVTLEVAKGIGTIRIDRPPMNALNLVVQRGLREVATRCADDDSVEAVVVYGGERLFAAGADVKEFATMSYADMVAASQGIIDGLGALAAIPKPTMAAITGYALGGGCEVALACDFRIAASNARLGQPEVHLGLIPGGGGTQRLARLVGPARAKDLVFTGRFVDATEALAIGLIDEIVEVGEGAPDDAVYRRAHERMSAFVGGPRLALRAAKMAIDSGLDTDLSTGLQIERSQFAAMFATRDARTGMDSFLENGPGHARFEGA